MGLISVASSPQRYNIVRTFHCDQMRVLHQDRFKGEIKVQIDAPDDLWHLYNIIQIGDILVMSTYRRDESAKADKVRAERSEKKRMVLGVKVEKMEFHDFDIRLRVTGRHRGRASRTSVHIIPSISRRESRSPSGRPNGNLRSWSGCGGRSRTPRSRRSCSSPWRTTRRSSR